MKTKELDIELGPIVLKGDLTIPNQAIGIVIFSHGSGSSRLSPRNRFVSEMLQNQGIGTFLFDLLTEEEDLEFETRFNIELLSLRLIKTTEWLKHLPEIKNLPIGYFGASTGAASALNAAAYFGTLIKAVVSRGGRPDLAMDSLKRVECPTLLIVGGLDNVVIEMNKTAFEELTCVKKLEIVPNASHLFEEPGKLEEVAYLAIDWYRTYFEIQI